MNSDDNKDKGDGDMTVAEIRKNMKSKKQTRIIPHLHSVNGKVKIDSKDPKQVKWFEEFKK